MSYLKSKAISNFIWKLMERLLAQGVSFIVSIVLARLLVPNDFGVVSIVLIFVDICNVFISEGVATSLIQKGNVDELDYSSMFYTSFVFSFFVYILLFFMAPRIAVYFGEQYSLLTPLLRVMALQIPISSFKTIQQTVVSRKLQFRKFFFSTLGGTMVSAIVGVWMAYNGFGAWSLIGQYLTNTIIDTIILTITVKWYPIKGFSWVRVKQLLPFGLHMLTVGLIDTTYNELRSFVIGKRYTAGDLSFYNRGKQIPSIVVTNINSSLVAVLFPVMSKFQTNIDGIVYICRKTIKISTYILFPMMFGLAGISNNLIILLLTEKWSEAIPYIKIFCVIYSFYPIYTVNLQAIKALGEGRNYLFIELSKKIVGIIILIVSIPYGTYNIAIGLLVATCVNYLINGISTKIVLGYSFKLQILDVLPNLLISIVTFIFIILIPFKGKSMLLCIVCQIIIGVLCFLLLSFVTKNDSFNIIVCMIKDSLIGKQDVND